MNALLARELQIYYYRKVFISFSLYILHVCWIYHTVLTMQALALVQLLYSPIENTAFFYYCYN